MLGYPKVVFQPLKTYFNLSCPELFLLATWPRHTWKTSNLGLIKVLASKPSDLSSLSGTYIMEEENQPLRVVFWGLQQQSDLPPPIHKCEMVSDPVLDLAWHPSLPWAELGNICSPHGHLPSTHRWHQEEEKEKPLSLCSLSLHVHIPALSPPFPFLSRRKSEFSLGADSCSEHELGYRAVCQTPGHSVRALVHSVSVYRRTVFKVDREAAERRCLIGSCKHLY